MSSPTINTLTSFSGADLVVSFANQVIGELQGISWSIQREKAPVFTLGSADARSFSRGKRAIAGSMQFAVFDHDSLVSAMQHVWDQIAPPAMFTAAGNLAVRSSEDFSTVLSNIKWNQTTSQAANDNFNSGMNGGLHGAINGAINGAIGGALPGGAIGGVAGGVTGGIIGGAIGGVAGGVVGGIAGAVNGYNSHDYGFSGTSAIKPSKQEGSNGAPSQYDSEYNYFVEKWGKGDDIYVPAGFSPIRGENIVYADTLPPFDVTLTYANEYGQTAFQKIYDVDILNESSGVSVDTIVMERQMTYIARRISPLIKGVYSREEGGIMKGVLPVSR